MKLKDLPYYWKFKDLKLSVVRFWERGRRGWSKVDVWGGLDNTLLKSLGEAMIYLGETAHGAPQGYPTNNGASDDTDFAAWSSDLKKHGNALVYNASIEDWAEERNFLSPEFNSLVDEAHVNTRNALLWVADNYRHLWD